MYFYCKTYDYRILKAFHSYWIIIWLIGGSISVVIMCAYTCGINYSDNSNLLPNLFMVRRIHKILIQGILFFLNLRHELNFCVNSSFRSKSSRNQVWITLCRRKKIFIIRDKEVFFSKIKFKSKNKDFLLVLVST